MTQLTKKRLLLATVLLLFCFITSAQTAADIIGQWKDVEQPDRQMEIYLHNDGLYYSKLINDKSKKPMNGKILLKKLKYDEATKTFKGFMSPPDANMEINATVSFSGTDNLQIVAKKLIMTKTLRLVRIK